MPGERFDDYVCDECGMAWREQGRDDLAPTARTFAPRWRELTAGVGDDALRTNPDEDTWSTAEYGWHLGTVLDWMAGALERMVDEDEPTIGWFGHEQDVRDAQPNTRGRDELTTRIDRGSSRLAAVLAAIDLEEWGREGEFPWGRRDVLDMGRNAVHEGVHHLGDVEQVLDRIQRRTIENRSGR